MQHETILILDFGSQYTQLIARRLRELGVKTVVERGDLGGEEIREASPIAIVLSGGPASVFEEGALQADPTVFDLGVPVLGICYGLHLMARDLGGDVRSSSHREYGLAELEVVQEGSVFARTPREQSVWMSHGDMVERMPDGFEVLARTSTTAVAAMFEGTKVPGHLMKGKKALEEAKKILVTEQFPKNVKKAAGKIKKWSKASCLSD